jgi:hypothetical protein
MIRILEVPGDATPDLAAVGAGPTSAGRVAWEDR